MIIMGLSPLIQDSNLVLQKWKVVLILSGNTNVFDSISFNLPTSLPRIHPFASLQR